MEKTKSRRKKGLAHFPLWLTRRDHKRLVELAEVRENTMTAVLRDLLRHAHAREVIGEKQ